MKVELKADERDGCVARITGCGVGGHSATFRFMDPEYAADPIKFDGDSVEFARDRLHGSVICTVADDAAGELRATLEGYSPDTSQPARRSARRGGATGEHDPNRTAPRGAVTADEKEVVQEGDTAGDSQYEAAGEPGGEAVADPQPSEPESHGGLGEPDGKPNS